MKEEEIKPLLCVKEFTDYFVRRAKRVIGLKNAEFETVSIDVHPDRKTVWVWFHGCKRIIARAWFTYDGRHKEMLDYRMEVT